MQWNGGWLGNWDGNWHGGEGGSSGPHYVVAELIVGGVGSSNLQASLVAVPAPAAGNVVPIRRIKPMRPAPAPSVPWDSDEDEALLLITGAL